MASLSSYQNSNFLMIFIQHMDKIFLSQISGLLVAHLALLSTQTWFLWSISGRSLQDPMPAIQTFGKLRIHPEDQNWSPDGSTLHSLLIHGFVSSYLARLLKMHLMKAFSNTEILQLHLVEICMISMTALPGGIWQAFFLLLAIWFLGYILIGLILLQVGLLVCQKYFSVISYILIL